MSLSRIVLTMVIVTYGTRASFWYDKISNKYSVSPESEDDYDNDADEEEYLTPNDSGESNFLYSDFPENDPLHETEIQGRQLPETGEAKSKKSQTWCKVKKVTRHHNEPGYEFFPNSYSEYDCIKHDGPSDNSIYSHDVCPVHHGHCVAMQKKYYFMKRKLTGKCWNLDVKAVRVGCKCIPPGPVYK